jgi:hypothetical protein
VKQGVTHVALDADHLAERFPWYDWVSGEHIEQGDLLLKFDVMIQKGYRSEPGQRAPARLRTADFIVLSQTCDLVHKKIDSVVLCPAHPYREFVRAAGSEWNARRVEDLRKGNIPGYHLLNSCEGSAGTLPLLVVDFHEIYSAPLRSIVEFVQRAGSRPRLQPPYWEHLAQAFARFFMRVGLPVEIPKDKLAIS